MDAQQFQQLTQFLQNIQDGIYFNTAVLIGGLSAVVFWFLVGKSFRG